MLQLFERGTTQPLDELLRQLAKMQYERTNLDLVPGSFRLRGDVLEIYPPTTTARSACRYGRRGRGDPRIDPVTGRVVEELDRLPVYPRTHYVTPVSSCSRRSPASAPSSTSGWSSCGEGQAARGAAALPADPLRPRDAHRARLLPGHRELLAPPHRPCGRRAAADPARLLPARLPVHHRRVARHRAPGRRHVPRRPLAQADPRRVRLPATVGPRQPPADLRGVRAAGPPVLFVSATPGPYELALCAARSWSR